MGTTATAKNEQVEQGILNEMAPRYDQMVSECLFEISG